MYSVNSGFSGCAGTALVPGPTVAEEREDDEQEAEEAADDPDGVGGEAEVFSPGVSEESEGDEMAEAEVVVAVEGNERAESSRRK